MQAPLTVPPSLLTQTSSTKLVLRFAEQPAQYHLSTSDITRSQKGRGSPIFTICNPWRAARITRRFIVSRQSRHDMVDLPEDFVKTQPRSSMRMLGGRASGTSV